LNIDDSRNYCEFKNNPGIYGCWSEGGISHDCSGYSSNDWHTCSDPNNYPSGYLVCSRDPANWGEQNFNQYDYLNSIQQIYKDTINDETVCWYKFHRDSQVRSLNIFLNSKGEGEIQIFTEEDSYQYVNQGSLSYSGNQILIDLDHPKDVYVLFKPLISTGYSHIYFSIYAEKRKETSTDYTWMITIITVILFTCWGLILTGIPMIYLGCLKTTRIMHLVEEVEVDNSKHFTINSNKSITDKNNLEQEESKEIPEIQVPESKLSPNRMIKFTENKSKEVLSAWS